MPRLRAALDRSKLQGPYACLRWRMICDEVVGRERTALAVVVNSSNFCIYHYHPCHACSLLCVDVLDRGEMYVDQALCFHIIGWGQMPEACREMSYRKSRGITVRRTRSLQHPEADPNTRVNRRIRPPGEITCQQNAPYVEILLSYP